MSNGKVEYVRVPVGYRVWFPDTKGKKNKKKINHKYKSKYVIASELVKIIVSQFSEDRLFIALADSWFPKSEVLKFVRKYENVEAVFNVPKNTVLYDVKLPSRSAKRGKPISIGKRLSLEKSFSMIDVPDTDYTAGCRMVTTSLFGKHNPVMAMVTQTKTGNSMRLYLCTENAALS